MLKSVPEIEGVEVFRVEQGGVAAKFAEFGAGAEERNELSALNASSSAVGAMAKTLVQYPL